MKLAELEQAYLDTRYWANAEGTWLGLMIGRPDPLLDHLLARRRKDDWAFLTAWNPGSTPRPRAENLASQMALEHKLRQAGHELWVGQGIGPWNADGTRWTEPSVLVIGIAREAAVTLGREHEQVAIVVGRRGGAPELVWC